MEAIELQHSLKRSGRGWGTERGELLDSFDSEMQEWEDQLQDMQRKIEELYNEVQARRGGNYVTMDNSKNDRMIDFGRGHHDNGFCDPYGSHINATKDHPSAVDGFNHGPNGYGYPVNHQNGGYGYPHSNSAGELGDLLQDYFGHGHGKTRKTNSAINNVTLVPLLSQHLKEITRGSQDQSVHQDEMKRRPVGNERISKVWFADEESENRKNRVSHRKSSPCRDLNKENTGANPPLRQREGPPIPPRSTSQMAPPDTFSPALDRKSNAPGVLVDRKCGSPSVLRKFGAMLQENEGKTLTDTGVVTNQVPTENKCPTAICQHKGLGGSRTTGRVPVQKCQADSVVLTARMDCSQERGAVRDFRRESQLGEGRGTSMGSYAHPKGLHAGGQRRIQVGGSPKPKARALGRADRDMGLVQGERARRPAPQPGEPRVDYRNLSGSYVGAQMIQRGGPVAGQKKDNGLIELLDMLDIEHEYSSCPQAAQTAYRQDTQQMSPAESFPATPTRNFSRPARPANQRPPSRWACCAPTALISAPSGPISHPPNTLARTPSPIARTPSPTLKQQSFCSYLLHTETAIM
ncbi:uncharacterized protein KIAA0408 isoform X1 [Salmo salar]|uniref:Uncharacterized protein KIAA0408-like isoform X1 n=1 Tax=Salmo salar TaxID=8030 RepID=A0ABM3F0M8_SALSA|nr:uncharacterized protein KIAA0408-like isoform X1 [Salmo salar]XP_045576870.1 uncharacterized protein KIAA0408-like isoform X1 [Salmo salar]XP_045576871.1 uncharacterized protein KIAA0408-like isoform X1 [Salmo salar]XP_045576872.1 uncharacterized protein KIAA0408-like isoform X1 [Salmo salar]